MRAILCRETTGLSGIGMAELPVPAFVEGRYLDVLVANPLATALSPRLRAGGNRLRDVFLDPDPDPAVSFAERQRIV